MPWPRGLVAFALAIVGACGGSTARESSESICRRGCDQLASVACSEPLDLSECNEICGETYQGYSECARELDGLLLCQLDHASLGCDESGNPAYVDRETVCRVELERAVACVAAR